MGFVLARSAEGPVCFRAGKRYQLGDSEPGPFAGRPDAAVVVDGITDLMSMPSAGDLVPEEMQTFILHPPTVTLPPRITHPIQLYDHFIRYRDATR